MCVLRPPHSCPMFRPVARQGLFHRDHLYPYQFRGKVNPFRTPSPASKNPANSHHQKGIHRAANAFPTDPRRSHTPRPPQQPRYLTHPTSLNCARTTAHLPRRRVQPPARAASSSLALCGQEPALAGFALARASRVAGPCRLSRSLGPRY
ncbi:uncharacterized protein K452DRAFT_154570 [Aplosporella prunicola CBS 121167]|uniref:Uncharacterized protein n=1 Tax=Aplosporella prunicola CBS 121167 TaxID=1176127 RepID=A0A6A6BJ76_9PEZI|nr:uncharacterized protein K452DRAFT_154570 [Aplosporella prunicola CBS 121167]KAF2144202.1 hypothetical protein K452DRAFT_154570 [Aplosporella prunicola CBS 121167]